jgi:hypothetical protein
MLSWQQLGRHSGGSSSSSSRSTSLQVQPPLHPETPAAVHLLAQRLQHPPQSGCSSTGSRKPAAIAQEAACLSLHLHLHLTPMLRLLFRSTAVAVAAAG